MVMLVRISSLVKLRSTPPSLHACSFSTIQAARPAGESLSAAAAVWGLVRWIAP
jgi:hypothetical protein